MRLAGIVVVVLAAACSGGTRSAGNGNPDLSDPHLSPACVVTDYTKTINAICKAQFPPAPGSGQTGANCTSDGQCASNLCLMPFSSGQHYCTVYCPNGNECPKGYSCQSTGTSGGPACYQDICIYGGTDPANCVTNLNMEAATACQFMCGAQLENWLNCIAAAGRICSVTEAHTVCGVERGQLDTCCPGCDGQDF